MVDAGDGVLHGGEEAVAGADVGEGLDVDVRRDREAPVALACAGPDGDALGPVAELDVVGVDVHGLSGVERKQDRRVSRPLIVRGNDGGHALVVGVVHDPDETLEGVAANGK